MKNILIISAIALSLNQNSCDKGKCRPSPGSKDYAVPQWMKQRSDGYWVVTTAHRFKKWSVDVFECKPDSIELLRLKKS